MQQVYRVDLIQGRGRVVPSSKKGGEKKRDLTMAAGGRPWNKGEQSNCGKKKQSLKKRGGKCGDAPLEYSRRQISKKPIQVGQHPKGQKHSRKKSGCGEVLESCRARAVGGG